jgi:transcription elongation factor S-II
MDNPSDIPQPIKPYVTARPTGADPLPIKYYELPYNTTRRAKLILFSSVFKQHEIFMQKTMDERFAILERIERACSNYTIDKSKELNIPTKWDNQDYQYIYTIICAKIAANIDQENTVHNTYLCGAILRDEIDINTLPKMTSQELFPEKYKTVLSKLELSKNVEKTVRTTAMYTCRRCKKSECTYENLYNRSLDEGVNLIITCVSCGKEWKA